MARALKRLPAFFYCSPSGREPIRAWLRGLEPEDRRIIGEDVKDVEFAWPIGMPLVRMVLLHGFVKKTQKTPKKDFDLALKRKKGESK